MSVGTFIQPDFESAPDGTSYKTAIDNSIAVLHRIAGAFAPHEQDTPDMTVRLDAGAIFTGIVLTEIAAQNTNTITAPSVNPRIDRVVVDAITGDNSIITGSEAAAAPDIPAGKLPVCQIALATSTTAITNDLITDERIGVGSSSLAGILTEQGGLISRDDTETIQLSPGDEGQVLTAHGAGNDLTWEDPADPGLSYLEIALTANYTLTYADTFYSILSLQLTQGVWLVFANLLFYDAGSAAFVTGQLVPGSGAAGVAGSHGSIPAAGQINTLTLFGKITISAATAYVNLQAASTGGSTLILDGPAYNVGSVENECTYIKAMKIG